MKWKLEPAPAEQSPEDDDSWRHDPDECQHVWQRVGFHLDFGDIYECDLCGDRTP